MHYIVNRTKKKKLHHTIYKIMTEEFYQTNTILTQPTKLDIMNS